MIMIGFIINILSNFINFLSSFQHQTTNLQQSEVVNNVIRLYRGNFPVPFIRSLVIMQPVRNQFELLKFQLTATLCRGGGRKGGGGGEREGASQRTEAGASLGSVEPGPSQPSLTSYFHLWTTGKADWWWLLSLDCTHYTVATLQYYSIKNCLASLSLTELLSLNLNNGITYTTYKLYIPDW